MTLSRRALPVALLVAAVGCGGGDPGPSPTQPPTPACSGTPRPYGQAVTDWWVPACSRAQNIYNDPDEAVGAPDAGGFGPDAYTGFVSLGFGGYVTLDMGGCFSDQPGNDLRVFQAVSNEPVTVYVSTAPSGPFTRIEAQKECGERLDRVKGFCDFDLATAGVREARYVRVEDGELFPCPGGTSSEGADLDAVQALGVPATGGLPGP